jgi:hypothetical protein
MDAGEHHGNILLPRQAGVLAEVKLLSRLLWQAERHFS